MKNADRIGEAGRPCSCPCSPASSARPPSGCRRSWLGCAEAGDWMTRPALHRGAQVGLAGAPGRAVAQGEEPGGRALLQAARRASGHQGVWAACRASIQHPAGHPGHTQSRRPAGHLEAVAAVRPPFSCARLSRFACVVFADRSGGPAPAVDEDRRCRRPPCPPWPGAPAPQGCRALPAPAAPARPLYPGPSQRRLSERQRPYLPHLFSFIHTHAHTFF